MTGLLCSPFSYSRSACLDLASALGLVPVSPLDGATAIGHQKSTGMQPDPSPCSRTWGAASPGVCPQLPDTPSRSVPLAGRVLGGTATHASPPRKVCARYLWSIISPPAVGTGLRGTEGMRNLPPAIPGIPVLGRARPGSARGTCWQNAAEGGGEGTDPGGDPVPCGNRAVSVPAGCGASRPEEPQCHHSLLLETPLACHPLTHLQARREVAAKLGRAGGRSLRRAARGWDALNHTVPPGDPASPPSPWQEGHTDALLLQGHRYRRATSSEQQDVYG